MSLLVVNPFRFGIIAPEFASLYEAFDPLTILTKQHFIEWFSGDALDSIWTFTQPAASSGGSQFMNDAVDEGLTIRKGDGASNNQAIIAFNEIRHYDETASIIIGIFRRVTDITARIGLLETQAGSIQSAGNEQAAALISDSGFKNLRTADGTTASQQDSDVAQDTNWTGAKITCQSSDILLHLDGILKVTKTTNLPTIALQPHAGGRGTSVGTQDMRIKYLEAYNT